MINDQSYHQLISWIHFISNYLKLQMVSNLYLSVIISFINIGVKITSHLELKKKNNVITVVLIVLLCFYKVIFIVFLICLRKFEEDK